MIGAVTFDCYNTILVDRPAANAERRAAAWARILADAAVPVQRGDVDRALAEAADALGDHWDRNVAFGGSDATAFCLDRLGLSVSADCRAALAKAFCQLNPAIGLAPNLVGTLTRLSSAGVRLAVVCDIGFTPSSDLRRGLERLGVLDFFDHLSFSDEVGCYKPAPEMFRHALAGLAVTDPAAVVHVGDMRRTDVAGARALGLTTVRYAGVVDDRSDLPDADHVITDHHQLLPILGLNRAARGDGAGPGGR